MIILDPDHPEQAISRMTGGRSVKALAELAGLTYPSVQRWIIRRRRASLTNFTAYARAAGYDVALIPRKQP